MKRFGFLNLIVLIVTIYLPQLLFSQQPEVSVQPVKESNKGKFYIYHGWHESNYSKSDIHFKGDNFNFTIYDVRATDRVMPYGLDPYLNPKSFTTVQTSSRIGYYFHNHYTVSLGNDHMKYVMTNGQTVKIDGVINTGIKFDKTYSNENINLSKEFLKYEHTNGLNLINIEINRVDDILQQWIKVNSNHIQVNLIEGVGMGFLFPHTDVTLLNFERHDRFNLAGYGFTAKAGVNITFFNHFFIQTELKGGWMNMPNVRITFNSNEEASQHFWALQKVVVFGGIFRLWK